MNSEAKVLVPGIPGHRAAIKPASSQTTEEVESKRKLGENEVTCSFCLGLTLKPPTWEILMPSIE